MIYTHTSEVRGERNENNLGGFFIGFLYRMVMPRFKNGLVKSITFSRLYVMDIPATAKSAF